MKALIASGSGRYADPWHPFERTSPLLAGVLAEAGFDVRIDHDVDRAMGFLSDIDLLVVNAGDPWRGSAEAAGAPEAAVAGFAQALDRGIGILALHCAVSSLRDYPEWAPAVGSMWVPGLSMHPDASETVVHGSTLPDGTEVADFTVFDERYCRLQRLGRSSVVATHDGARSAATREPTAWVRRVGASRIAVDVLGHDERSYASVGHRALLTRLARWVVGDRRER